MTRRALVTGLGFITPIGNDRAKVTEHLRQGIHGFEMVEFLSNPRLTVRVAGTIKDFVANTPHWRDWRYPEKFSAVRDAIRGLAPHGLYAFCAMQEALADAQLDPDALKGGPKFIPED